jgi:hypothetical protein
MAIPQAVSNPLGCVDPTGIAAVADNGTAAARTMLDLFASVGATRFNVSWINIAHKPRRPRSLRKTLTSLGGPLPRADNDDWLDAVHINGISHADLHRTIPALLDTSIAERLSLIIRPYGPNVMFIQFDDLSADKLPSLAPAMFLIFETSPQSFQAWCAIPGEHNKDLARRGKRGVHSDKSASGATRIAGSFNFKQKYAPNFPRVTIINAQPGQMTSVDELEHMGLLAPPEEFTPCPRRAHSPSAVANGQAMQKLSTAHRAIARAPVPTAALPIFGGAFLPSNGGSPSNRLLTN